MKIVAGAVEIGRHRGDEIASMLAPVGLTKCSAPIEVVRLEVCL
jgi:hypothetical protein